MKKRYLQRLAFISIGDKKGRKEDNFACYQEVGLRVVLDEDRPLPEHQFLKT